MLIFYLHCNLYLDFTYFRFYKIKLHINPFQCKTLIVPEEGWFGQPKYSTPSKQHPTFCRFLLLYSSFICEVDHLYVKSISRRIIVPVACLKIIATNKLDNFSMQRFVCITQSLTFVDRLFICIPEKNVFK